MKTESAKAGDIQRGWFIVDAQDVVLGRLSTRVASVLRGKHKPTFTPHADTGDFVIVVNADKVKVTGNKEKQKKYWHYTGYIGGAKSITLEKQRAEHPERIISHAVKGMLPKGPLGRKMLKKLKVYAGESHPHKAQKPEPLSI
jgi:large subunit ribosomal protein L13